MTSPMYNVILLQQSIQYTGSNSAHIDAQVPNTSIVSEVGGVLTLSCNGDTKILNTNDWLVFDVSGYTVFTNALYLAERDCVAICSEVAAVQSDVDDLAEDLSDLATGVSTLSSSVTGAFVRSLGVAPVPTLLLGQDTTVAVTLQPAMPDSSYSAYAATFGGVNLADLDVTAVSVVDTDTVNVAVDNVGLGTVSGVTVMVHAID